MPLTFNEDWNNILKALYYDKQGDWSRAHEIVDGHPGRANAHMHAYLHRKEGDDWNARYWYRQAGQPVYQGSLDEEWADLWAMYQ